MFGMFTFLQLYSFSTFSPKNDHNDAHIQIMLQNLNAFLNTGINKNIFSQLLGNSNNIEIYNEILNLISDKSLIVDVNLLRSKVQLVSSLTNVNTTIYSLFPQVADLITNNKEDLISIQPIFHAFSSEMSKVLNIDANILKQLYDCIVINNKNDGAKIGNLLKILNLPVTPLTTVHKVLSVFESKLPISSLFEATKTTNLYSNFIEKVENLKVPNDSSEPFFSLLKFVDVLSSIADIMDSIWKNFVNDNYQKFFDPFVHGYVFKPLDIFELSLYDRSKALITILTEIDSYSQVCSSNNISNDEDITGKCLVYNYTNSFLSKKFHELDNISLIQQGINIIRKFQNTEFNLTEVLTNDFGFSAERIHYLFGLIANLTYSNKSYLDVMEGLQSGNGEFSKKMRNLSKSVILIPNMNKTTNMRSLFENLNLQTVWFNITDSICDLSQNKPFCESSFVSNLISTDKCEDLMNNFIKLAKVLITKQKVQEIDKDYQDVIVTILLPIISEIDKPLSVFLNSCYRISRSFINKKLGYEIDANVSFSLFLKNFGETFDHLLEAADKLIPYSFKAIPIISHFYSEFLQKSHQILNCIKNDNNITSLLETIQKGSGVIVEMLKNAASSYQGLNTTVDEITKAMTPSSFIDVYQTASQLSALNIHSMKMKAVASSIQFDNSSTSLLTINNIIPIKYFSLYSDELTDSMQSGFLSPELLSKGFGITLEDFKQSMFHTIQSILAEPAQDIKNVAISLGHNKMYTDAYIDAIGIFANKVYNGENVLARTNQYYRYLQEPRKSLSGGAIAGIIIAVMSVVTLSVLGVMYLITKKKEESVRQEFGISLVV